MWSNYPPIVLRRREFIKPGRKIIRSKARYYVIAAFASTYGIDEGDATWNRMEKGRGLARSIICHVVNLSDSPDFVLLLLRPCIWISRVFCFRRVPGSKPNPVNSLSGRAHLSFHTIAQVWFCGEPKPSWLINRTVVYFNGGVRTRKYIIIPSGGEITRSVRSIRNGFRLDEPRCSEKQKKVLQHFTRVTLYAVHNTRNCFPDSNCTRRRQ